MTRRITVDVYEADNTTPVDTLTSDKQRTFLKDLSVEGSYSFEVKLGHADEALLIDGRVARFSIDGTPRWPGLIEPRDIVYADPQNRQAGRVVKVSGRGLLAILERAPIYPELGLGRISPGTRYFGAASGSYDVSSLPPATAFHKVGTTTSSDPYYGFPKDFPDKDAYWIGPSDGVTSLPARIGFYWLFPTDGEFVVPAGEGGDYRISGAWDDGAELFVDGDKVAAESSVGLWGITNEKTITLDEGIHRFAARVENFDRPNPSTNATAFVLSIAKELAGGTTLDTPILRTDSGWGIFEVFGAAEPGMSPGLILDLLLTEAQTNGYLVGLTWDFSSDTDSNGTFWPKEIDLAFQVGTTSILNVVQHFVDEHLADVEMDATGLVLHAYVSKGDDLTGSVSAMYGENLGRLGFSVKPPGPNTAISQTAEGRWVERTRSAAVAKYGKRGVGLSLGSAPSATSADRQADAYFDDNSKPVEAITDMQLEEVTAVPLADFDVGDIITATASDGTTAKCRVQGIGVAEDAAGNPIWTPDLVRQPIVLLARFYDGNTVTPALDFNAYHGRFAFTVDPFTWPAGTDDQFDEFDFVIEDPADATRMFWIYVGSNTPLATSTVTGGFTFDSSAPPAWADYFGVGHKLKTDYDGTFPNPIIYDGTYTPYDAALDPYDVDPASDPDWFREAP